MVHALLRSRASLAAENLFLRRQLALYQERKVQPHRPEIAVMMQQTACLSMHEFLRSTPVGASTTMAVMRTKATRSPDCSKGARASRAARPARR
jgi:hypothetical protein